MDLTTILRTVDERHTVATYAHAAHQLDSESHNLQPLRISLLSTYTIDPLVPFLQVEAAREGFAADIHVAPFNRIHQQLLTPSDATTSNVIFIAQLLEDTCPAFIDDFLTLTDIDDHLELTVTDLTSALRTFRSHSPCSVVMHNLPQPSRPLLGIHEPAVTNSQSATIRRLNERLTQSVTSIPGCHMLDFDRICADVGYTNWRDNKTWYMARAPLSTTVLRSLARAQATFLRALHGSPRKCLVLDLDNTLWGGVIGEDGLSGIRLGHTYPGNIYRDVQRAILQLSRRGILLAVNSKNNQRDVDEVLAHHPDMLLRPEHFAATRINWRAKPDNMLELADELNIGLDSLVFLDDNPAECALMRQALPQVWTLEACDANGRPDPVSTLKTLRGCTAFDRLSFTTEDRRRGDFYRQQSRRRQYRDSAATLDKFLLGLETQVTIRPVDEFLFPRVLELIHKTNQFNLTTRRHSAARLQQFVDDPNCGVFALDLQDRFGDSGTVGTAIVRVQNGRAQIDTFLLSCRVIGRSVETALLRHLIDWSAGHGAELIDGHFIPTAKNAPAADFFREHGFSRYEPNGEGTRWRLSLMEDIPFSHPTHIRLTSAEEVVAW